MEIPRYEIKRELGQGGTATVYLAVQQSLGREVALKVMAPVLVADADFRARFLKEGKTIAKLQHPNIITVYDIGVSNNYYYMALEYAAAGNLRDRVLQGVSVEQALDILKAIASALQYAHDNGVVHRDVKSANILFIDHQKPVLTDFGVAKLVNSNTQLTQAGVTVGTPRYMSPEQALGEAATTKSDLYSLGIIFYEMLLGHCPYEPKSEISTPLAILYKHINDPVPQLPPIFERYQPIIEKLLAKNPDDRFASANALINAINALQIPAVGATQLLFPEAVVAARDQQLEEATPPPSGAATAVRPGQQRAASAAASKPPRRRSWRRWGALVAAMAVVAAGLYASLPFLIPPAPTSLPPMRDYRAVFNVEQRLETLASLGAIYRQILAIDAANAEAQQRLRGLADNYHDLAQLSWSNLDRAGSLAIVAEGLNVDPDHAGLKALERLIGSASDGALQVDGKGIDQWLAEAEVHWVAERYTTPKGYSAVDAYRRVLQIDPDNATAKARLAAIGDLFVRTAQQAITAGEAAVARRRVEQGLLIYPQHQGLLALRRQLLAEAASTLPSAGSSAN